MRPALRCTRRRGRGGAGPTGDLDEWTSIYVRASVCEDLLVYRHLLVDSEGRAVPSLLAPIPSGFPSHAGRRCGR